MLRHTQEEIGGDAASIEIHASELLRRQRLVDEILARHTGQPMERVSADTEREFFLSPEEAKEYGIVDEVISDRAVGIQPGWQSGDSMKQED